MFFEKGVRCKEDIGVDEEISQLLRSLHISMPFEEQVSQSAQVNKFADEVSFKREDKPKRSYKRLAWYLLFVIVCICCAFYLGRVSFRSRIHLPLYRESFRKEQRAPLRSIIVWEEKSFSSNLFSQHRSYQSIIQQVALRRQALGYIQREIQETLSRIIRFPKWNETKRLFVLLRQFQQLDYSYVTQLIETIDKEQAAGLSSFELHDFLLSYRLDRLQEYRETMDQAVRIERSIDERLSRIKETSSLSSLAKIVQPIISLFQQVEGDPVLFSIDIDEKRAALKSELTLALLECENRFRSGSFQHYEAADELQALSYLRSVDLLEDEASWNHIAEILAGGTRSSSLFYTNALNVSSLARRETDRSIWKDF